MKPGTRLKSLVCTGEFVVVRYGRGEVGCGGAPMGEGADAGSAEPDAALAGGTVTGKRYVDVAGTVELLCVKAGKGTPTLDGAALIVKEAKPLPASD
ncbi:hypothetical protein CVO77_04040 [Sphingopyxis lindanitolerans]|uniref:Uncharacterized protein n=1 Tax=Sphingopyxis lindanitolerans TaxID=2054227 RepID=A0A2S8B5T6_9SPHN|nr:hypothetical protein [Sphingopyxis lindanitolerans]PQM27745.1 hypothetical protein CVO77_04040 [Sphingopyxis lindanitolerans]